MSKEQTKRCWFKHRWIYSEKRIIKFKGYNSKGEYVENKTGQSGSMFVIFRTIGTIIKSGRDVKNK